MIERVIEAYCALVIVGVSAASIWCVSLLL
jgi:hypothetical protein